MTGDRDGQIKIWNLADGTFRLFPEKHEGRVRRVAIAAGAGGSRVSSPARATWAKEPWN